MYSALRVLWFNVTCLILNYLSLLGWIIRFFLCVLYYSAIKHVKDL